MLQNYKGIPCESDSEMFILDWLLELKSRGFIHSIERSMEIMVAPGLSNRWVQRIEMKTKVKEEPKEQPFLQPHYFTSDFDVLWYPHTPKAIVWPVSKVGLEARPNYALIGHSFPIRTCTMVGEEEVTGTLTGQMTYIEVKPDQDFQNMTRAFMINKAWVWESRKMFINLMKPQYTFKTTFTPVAYTQTRVKRTERAIKWPIKTVDQYLQSIGYETPATL